MSGKNICWPGLRPPKFPSLYFHRWLHGFFRSVRGCWADFQKADMVDSRACAASRTGDAAEVIDSQTGGSPPLQRAAVSQACTASQTGDAAGATDCQTGGSPPLQRTAALAPLQRLGRAMREQAPALASSVDSSSSAFHAGLLAVTRSMGLCIEGQPPEVHGEPRSAGERVFEDFCII